MGKQFKLMGSDGLYLTYRPSVAVTSSNYMTQMLQDNDFFPKTANDAALYSFKNSKYVDPGTIIGSNALSSANSSLTHTEIKNPNQLILNEVYYNTFNFYFNFTGSQLFGYTPGGGISGADFSAYLNRLRIKIYAQLGNNLVSLNFSNLQFWHYGISAWHSADGTTRYNPTTQQGFQLNTGLNGESCIDLGYGTGTVGVDAPYYLKYSDYFDNTSAPGGYFFRVSVSMPNLTEIATGSKDYTLVVKYLNIGATGSTTLTAPYNTTEAVELMSNVYPWFQLINPYVVPPYYGGGGVIGGLESF